MHPANKQLALAKAYKDLEAAEQSVVDDGWLDRVHAAKQVVRKLEACTPVLTRAQVLAQMAAEDTEAGELAEDALHNLVQIKMSAAKWREYESFLHRATVSERIDHALAALNEDRP